MSKFNIEQVEEKVVAFVGQYPSIDKPLTSVSQKVGVGKAYVALTFAIIPLLIIFMMGSGNFIIDLIGFIYPMYGSIKAIESKDKEDDTLWLTYWLVFCVFKIVEGVADALISAIPFYFLGKLGFLVWCYNPSTKGARVVYESVIKPFIVPALGLEAASSSSAAVNSSSHQASLHTASVMIKSVTMKNERNIYVECSCQPPASGRSRAATEKLAYKTSSRLGVHCAFNERLTFMRLPDVLGSLTIDVREKPTFEEGTSIGKAVVALAELLEGDQTVRVEAGEGETVTIVYSLTVEAVRG